MCLRRATMKDGWDYATMAVRNTVDSFDSKHDGAIGSEFVAQAAPYASDSIFTPQVRDRSFGQRPWTPLVSMFVLN